MPTLPDSTVKTPKRSKLELAFEDYWTEHIVPLDPYYGTYRIETTFHPVRKWRFDFAWTDRLLSVEVEGGTYTNGRHSRALGYAGDCDKYNQAALRGWCVLRFTAAHLKRGNIVEACELVKLALDNRKNIGHTT